MSDLIELIRRNEKVAKVFSSADLTPMPRLSTIVLTCVDARVDPAHMFDLAPGDAVVIRNAGGRVTPAVLQDMAILGTLAANLAATPRQMQLVIVQHNDCGMARLAIPEIQAQVAARLGLGAEEVEAMAITDPAASVRASIERLRSTPGTPDQLVVSGFVYDVGSGTVEQVVAPAPLRAA